MVTSDFSGSCTDRTGQFQPWVCQNPLATSKSTPAVEQSKVMAHFCAGQHRSWKLKRDFKRAVSWANQMSQLVKVPAAKPNLSSIPMTTVVGENQLPQMVL